MPDGVVGREVRRVPRPDPRPPLRPKQPSEPSMRFVLPSTPDAPTIPIDRRAALPELEGLRPRARSSPPPLPPKTIPPGPAENVELGSEHLVSLPDDTEMRLRRLIAEELFPVRPSRDGEVTARSQAPPGASHLRLVVVAILSFTLVWNVVMGAYRAYASAADERAKSLAASGIAAVPLTGPRPRQCTASPPRILSRSVLVRGGVEAAASDNRVGLGVVKGPRDGIALELDAATGAVTASTKVIASEALLRVLPSLEPIVPLDATPEIGPLHALGAGGDGEAYETGVEDGVLVWHARTRDITTKLWPMPSDVEVPRAARSGDNRVLVFRRDDAIWLGSVLIDRDGVHAGALVQVSEPAVQVGAPSIDARGDLTVAAWTQRDARRGPWTLRWGRFHNGERAGALQQLAPQGAENAIAPSVSVLADGSLLLAWTEGGTGHHRVRAELFGPDDKPIGGVFDVSAPNTDAGQAQVALASEGRGAAGYLVTRGGTFDLVATPIACQ